MSILNLRNIFSCAWQGSIKYCNIYQSMTINNSVISGNVKLFMYDLRKESSTYRELQEIFSGEKKYVLVKLPLGIANSYKAHVDKMVILANYSTEPHYPNEIIRIDALSDKIPYIWDLKYS
jgi:dTDP-4-dehydrorhamnose 3,5-epimerase